MDNLLARIGQLINPVLRQLRSERGEVVIPFIETVAEEQQSAVKQFVTNSGATDADLTNFKTFDEFLNGYKPKTVMPVTAWKGHIGTDLANSPTMQKFEDNPDGLKKAIESHLSLEKLLGHDKVPIPKDENDAEGWARFRSALNIPDKADGYGLADAQIPDALKGMAFDKKKFAEIVHAQNLTPAQAKGLWTAYTQMSMAAYQQIVTKRKGELDNIVNQLRAEWGDAYDGNVDLGQMVINKFAADDEDNNYITAAMSKDPRLIRFLSRLGNQFAENKIGEFKFQKFTKSPDEAKSEIDSILRDAKHPYNDPAASEEEHQKAVEYVLSLYKVVNKTQ